MEMKFLQQEDCLTFISENSLNKRLRDNTDKLGDCENAAFGHIYDKLSQRYNISQEVQRQGSNRNPSLVRWMVILAVYYLYQSGPDDEIPEHVRQNYKDVLKEIEKVGSGRQNTTLTPVLNNTGKPKTVFAGASRPRRSHNPFE
ncbi:MAG: DUF1320 domain-containing protein [Parabacteroides sp.]|nr:DUF1320 domain-containing protein [Parabacteroides sp.]